MTGPLLGMRELDIIHPWPANWQGFSFDHLLSWIPNTKASTELPPPPIIPVPRLALSKQQRAAFDLIHDHTFGHSQAEQLLLIVIGTAGTGKSFLINVIRYLFDEKNCAESLKVTAPSARRSVALLRRTPVSKSLLCAYPHVLPRLRRITAVVPMPTS